MTFQSVLENSQNIVVNLVYLEKGGKATLHRENINLFLRFLKAPLGKLPLLLTSLQL